LLSDTRSGNQALQPKPELEGAAQLVLDEAKRETAFCAGWLQTGQGASGSCFLRSFSNVLLHGSQ